MLHLKNLKSLLNLFVNQSQNSLKQEFTIGSHDTLLMMDAEGKFLKKSLGEGIKGKREGLTINYKKIKSTVISKRGNQKL